jgi:hypothetical protein
LDDIKKSQWSDIIDSYDKYSYYDNSNPINIEFNKILNNLYNYVDFRRSTISSFRWKWWQTDLVKIMKIFLWIDNIEKYSIEDKEKIKKQMTLFQNNNT